VRKNGSRPTLFLTLLLESVCRRRNHHIAVMAKSNASPMPAPFEDKEDLNMARKPQSGLIS